MKKILLISFLQIALFRVFASPWTQKASLSTGRAYAVGFSIGGKGYVGLGATEVPSSTTNVLQDFWEYNPVTNFWTQKANFGGTARAGAVGFSIGTKGYIGTGEFYSPKDFWEWDPATNTWTSKAIMPVSRSYGIGFSIGTKGYVGLGFPDLKDFWEWNQTTNAWTSKSDFPGVGRYSPVAFVIGSKGYVGTGGKWNWSNYSFTAFKNFWEWDPQNDTWTQIADFGGTSRGGSVAFAIGSKGYVGMGGYSTGTKDFYEYDQPTNTWYQKSNFPDSGRLCGVGFSIGTKGYIGTGDVNETVVSDFWEYDPSLDTVQIVVIPEYAFNTITSVNIFPNPSSGKIIISSEESFENVSIFNVFGENIRQFQIKNPQTEIDLSNQPKGIYFISASIKDKLFLKKIVIN